MTRTDRIDHAELTVFTQYVLWHKQTCMATFFFVFSSPIFVASKSIIWSVMRPLMYLFISGHNLTDSGLSHMRLEFRCLNEITVASCHSRLSTIFIGARHLCLTAGCVWVVCVCVLLQRAKCQRCVGCPIVPLTDGSPPCVCLISITQADFLSAFLLTPLSLSSS